LASLIPKLTHHRVNQAGSPLTIDPLLVTKTNDNSQKIVGGFPNHSDHHPLQAAQCSETFFSGIAAFKASQ
jgi:hypothetical protein